MPTDKRERQRAGRQSRRAAAQEAQKRAVRRRQIITVLIFVVVIVGIALAINLSSDKTAEDVAAKDGTTTTVRSAEAVAPECPPATPEGADKRTAVFTELPDTCIDPASAYTAEVETDAGTFVIALDSAKAPVTVNSFVFLSRHHAYDGVDFHRVIPGFVVQGGDVEQKGGTGGPGYTIPDELPQQGEYKVGSVAMANTSQPNTGGSQFFIITGDQGIALPPQYTLFGTVIDGLDVVKAIEADGTPAGTPSVKHKIVKVTITERKG